MTTGPLHVGVAQVDITPVAPTPLAGFAVRNNARFEGIDHPLSLKAFWWSVGDEHALLVVADILWWAPEEVDRLRARIARQWRIPEERIILHATHTHSAPHSSRVFTESLGIWDDAWIELLETRLFEAVGAAWEARVPARVRRGQGSSGIGINRRVALGVEPEATSMVDPEITVLRIDRETGEPIAVLVHYACHPTINELPRVSPEFPGVMCERVSARHGNSPIVAFLQGTCGDINPLPFLDRGKRPIGDADVIEMGEVLAGDVLRVLDAPMDEVPIIGISSTRTVAMLEMEQIPSPEELDVAKDEPGVTGEWARVLLANPELCAKQLGVEITHLRLGEDLAFLAMAAEVTTPYGLAIKGTTGKCTLPLPYSNGMVGYVITDAQLAQGGYEAIESTTYFGLPSAFAPGIEHTFMSAITRALLS
jgi:hypothetical protein